MQLESTICYRAIKARDHRFDGHFFVAVSSTGIYCRPVCKAKTPKLENCSFFSTAAAAEAKGFRPCLVCRPEIAPGRARSNGPAGLVRGAIAYLEEASFGANRLEDVASRLGVSDRHLRRLFEQEVGVSPVAYVQTQRLLMAKRLLTETRLPITEVALASGFNSLRRFNALFAQRYRLNPRSFRRVQPKSSTEFADCITLELAYRPPYDWPALLRFLADRAVDGVERVDDTRYARTIRITAHEQEFLGWIQLQPLGEKAALQLRVSHSLVKALPQVIARVRHLTDANCNPEEIGNVLGALCAGNPGLRVPGARDGFDIACRAILGQQITVRGARTLAGRFATVFGQAFDGPGLSAVFPRPADIARRRLSSVARLGIVATRAQAIISIARALADGTLDLRPGADVEANVATLKSIRGVGEWTAQYIAMRALAWPDAFPHSDLALRKALGGCSPRKALQTSEQWRPWRAYAVMHLWNSLRKTDD